MSEKRMAMAIATMKKELSDRASALGANAVANLKLDFELPKQGKVLNLIATADAVKMRSVPKSNPAKSKKIIINLKNKTQSDYVNKVRKELTKKGIEFDTDITGGKYPKVRTWFLDFSLKGATAKQVIAQLKKAKIPHKVEKEKPSLNKHGSYEYRGTVISPQDGYFTTMRLTHKQPMMGIKHETLEDAKNYIDNIMSSKSNPANPKKVDKGKKLYKHMNGKDVGKQTTEKIDIGDVWYQVGEGGCWSIGYMSGKETKNKDQKYIHNFNEETKDGNTPKLYATMPENGKPLLIIKGGTWKIKTDNNGMAWIYD
jgi:hypothetical protein